VVIADDPYRKLRFAGADQGRQVFFDPEHTDEELRTAVGRLAQAFS
jgi:hypothetical protein